MTRRQYSLLDLLRDEPRTRETLSYRDLRLHRRMSDGGRYNVGRASDGEQLCVLDVDDFESEGALQARLDDLSEEIATEPAVIEPDATAVPPLRADGAGVGHAFDQGLLRAMQEIWPFKSLGTGLLGFVCAIAAAGGFVPGGTLLVALLGGVLIYASTRLARDEGRRAYVEGER
ncbi:hypothetical protein DU500_09095 [Haloplanus rubicundus]|uniref:Uncharacterized protein n=1 Tax=Haloplanus rubicundus TaxID=1547898 RepID=A0A345E2Z7_9EURY|nr:hypothetical protein [Haloplanus rubicundus]AXG06569.1 hypothetical protein DU500_09095 [Haloplanus rubicundus]